MDPIIVYIANVEHKFGLNTYIAKSAAGALTQVAGYCRDGWIAEDVGTEEELASFTDAEIVVRYFECVETEYYNLTSSFLTD